MNAMLALVENPEPVRETLPAPGPRERAVEQGVPALGDDDLLAIVLGTGLTGCHVTRLARDLLERLGGVEGIARLGAPVMAEIPGVGLAKALRLAAGMELGRRALIRSIAPRPIVGTSSHVAALFTTRLAWKEREEIWVVSLDGRNGIRSMRRVAEGGLHSVTTLARDVLRVALQDAASGVILVHNHPSGDPTPSHTDCTMTDDVVQAGRAVGVPLVDHVIVSSSGRYVSMLDLGLLPRC